MKRMEWCRGNKQADRPSRRGEWMRKINLTLHSLLRIQYYLVLSILRWIQQQFIIYTHLCVLERVCGSVVFSEKPHAQAPLLPFVFDILGIACNILCGYLFAWERISETKFPGAAANSPGLMLRVSPSSLVSCQIMWLHVCETSIDTQQEESNHTDGQKIKAKAGEANTRSRRKTAGLFVFFLYWNGEKNKTFFIYYYRLCFGNMFSSIGCACTFDFERARESEISWINPEPGHILGCGLRSHISPIMVDNLINIAT